MEVLTLAFRFILATVFLMAGLVKLRARQQFARALEGYDLLPERLTGPVAASLPPLEVGCGVTLALGLLQTPVSAALAGMLLVFTVAIVVNLLRGREMSCGCFGVAVETRITWLTVARNLTFAGFAIVLAVMPARALSLRTPWEGAQPSSIETREALAVLTAAVVFMLGTLIVREALGLRAAIARFELAAREGKR